MSKFKKGQSGNPRGRPREIAEIRALARTYTDDAIAALAEIALNKRASAAARVSAASALLDRGYGRPTQFVEAKVGPLDKLTVDEKRSLLEVIAALADDAEGAGDGASEVYH